MATNVQIYQHPDEAMKLRVASERVELEGDLVRTKTSSERPLVLMVICCAACMPQQVQNRSTTVPLDSSEAVELAIGALKPAVPYDSVCRVLEFSRDKDGAIIYLVPVRPAGTTGAGGGGRVRVWANRKTKILELGM